MTKFRHWREGSVHSADKKPQVYRDQADGKTKTRMVPVDKDIVKTEEAVEIEELTAAEKKLVNQMYDKKGNLTPLGKKVMNHGKKPGDRGYVESVDEAKVDEISVGKMTRYGKAAAKDAEKHRNTVKTALDQPASPKKADAGLKAMGALRKRSRGSDMYVNKMTGRSKVKPTAG